MTADPPTDPRARFRQTLFRVLVIQAIALFLLWVLQQQFGR